MNIWTLDYRRLRLPVSLPVAVAMLAFVGLARISINQLYGFQFAGGLWYTFDPGVVFTMLVWPNFLCFFPAMILDFFFHRWKIPIESHQILGFSFYIQLLHLLVPLIEYLQKTFDLPFAYMLPIEQYMRLALSPLALTPLIFLVTTPTSLGVTIAWFIATLLYLSYGWKWRAPMGKFLLVLMLTFYVIYVMGYPSFIALGYSFGNNFYYGMSFLLALIGPLIYFKSRGIH